MAVNRPQAGVGNPIGPYTEEDTYRRPPLTQKLQVSDICELAKAGVTLDAKDVHDLLSADSVYSPVPVQQQNIYNMTLEERILHRWQSSRLVSASETFSNRGFREDLATGVPLPFTIGKVLTHGDKQYVFVQKEGNPPVVIEDDCALFPSDALMGALHLMIKNLPDAPTTGNASGGVTGGGMGGAGVQAPQGTTRIRHPVTWKQPEWIR